MKLSQKKLYKQICVATWISATAETKIQKTSQKCASKTCNPVKSSFKSKPSFKVC